MKTNLKNLPKYLNCSGQVYGELIEIWAKNFENELRQWKAVIEINNSKDPKALVLKIILGEDNE